MLKWLRIYQKYILAVGVTLLMVVFLVPSSLLMLQPQPADQVVGELDGRELKAGRTHEAGVTLRVLSALHPMLLPAVNVEGGDTDGLPWVLMLQGAEDAGLNASVSEAIAVLDLLQLSEQDYALLASNYNLAPAHVHEAVRQWIVIRRYQDLLTGVRFTSLSERLAAMQTAMMAAQTQQQFLMQMAFSTLRGEPRMSDALIASFTADLEARASIELVTLSTANALNDAAPDDASLQAMFDEHKFDAPGASEPYGFGYRLPKRVKVEYLAVPVDQLLATVTVDELAAYRFYEANLSLYTTAAQPDALTQPKPRPFSEVEAQITSRLEREKAEAEATAILQGIRQSLMNDARDLETDAAGYYTIDDSWTPKSLEVIAAEASASSGVQVRATMADRWMTQLELSQLQGVNNATAPGSSMTTFPRYAMSVKELADENTPPQLQALRLQVGLPSLVLASPSARYLFRVVDVAPSQAPANLDAVRDQVVRDARQLATYKDFKSRFGVLESRVIDAGMSELAEDYGAEVLTPAPFSRKSFNPYAGGLMSPMIDGVGMNDDFVTAVFDVVNRLAAAGDVADAPTDERVVLFADDRTRQVFVALIVGYEPISQTMLDEYRGYPAFRGMVAEFASGLPDANTFDSDHIQKRVGYQPAEGFGDTTDEGGDVADHDNTGDAGDRGSAS